MTLTAITILVILTLILLLILLYIVETLIFGEDNEDKINPGPAHRIMRQITLAR